MKTLTHPPRPALCRRSGIVGRGESVERLMNRHLPAPERDAFVVGACTDDDAMYAELHALFTAFARLPSQ